MKEAGEEGNDVADENIVAPDVLYKYCAFNKYTKKIFTHNEIYFPSPDELNDPFDSKPHLTCGNTRQGREDFFRKYYQEYYRERSRKEIFAMVQKIVTEGEDSVVVRKTLELSVVKFRKKLGICCFTEIRDNILMWAHYAKQHTGFCLEFDAKNDFFRPRVLKVKYKRFQPELNVMRLNSYAKGELAKRFLIKANDWKYEQEWRIVEKGGGTQKFPEDTLIGVILGCRISGKNKDNEENVLKWCRERKHRPALYRAKEKPKKFGLDIVRIENY